jgi:hypothetical protein
MNVRPDVLCGHDVLTSKGPDVQMLLLHNLEPVFLNHRIRQHIFRDALQLRLRFIAVPAIEIENEKLALPHIGNLRITQTG